MTNLYRLALLCYPPEDKRRGANVKVSLRKLAKVNVC